jgi:alpha-galactosidase
VVLRRERLALVVLLAAPGLGAVGLDGARIEGDGIRLELDGRMRSRVVATFAGEVVLGPFTESETLLTSTGAVGDFALESRDEVPVHDALGTGTRVTVSGRAGSVVKRLEVTAYPGRPRWLFVSARYVNEGTTPVRVAGARSHRYQLDAPGDRREPAFWSYQSGSYERRPDWVLPLTRGFTQQNFLGMNETDYGGGTPVVDVWRRDVGLAIGHLELLPKPVSLPVRRLPEGGAEVALSMAREVTLAPGEGLDMPRTFVAVHRGDHWGTLRAYSAAMRAQGVKIPEAPKDAFEPIWCAWGYGRAFTPRQVFETLPVAKRLGFRWAVLDDGWQVAEGDWTPVATKFPAGDADMKALVDRIHAEGLKAQLWWAPLAADPGSRTDREHPDWLLRNADASPRRISWWDANYLCPAHAPVRADAAAFARKALVEWGFDGLKIDGQHLNAAPPCFNPAHAHATPEDAPEGVPGFFAAIWDAAQAAKPGALVEICPCGTGYSFFTLPYLNMVVASDPESSWQVRLKGKTLKALAGDRVAYFGDHVELSQGGTDFASTFGVGGVIGTNFAWPGASGKKDKSLLLTPERERLWARWTKLYDEKRLSEGEYLGGLYDIGFDRPEAHVIAKGGFLYYAFYARKFSGAVELRALEPRSYRITDYVNGRDLGTVQGPMARVDARFQGSLLLEARPVAAAAANAGLKDWTHRVRIAAWGLHRDNADLIVREAGESRVFGIEVDNDVPGRYESLLDPAEKLAAIRELAQKAHAAGNRAFVYIAGTECITKDADKAAHSLARDHPDWLQRKRGGEPAVFGSGSAFWIVPGDEDVWVSPYAKAWRELYMTRVREIAATGIDGIYVDVPYWMTHFDGWEDSWASFDDATVEAFRERTGLDARRDVRLGDFADPGFRRWVRFRIDTITELMREIDRNAKSVNPGIKTIAEIYPGIEREAVVVGADVYELYTAVDAIAHEYEFGGGDHMATSRTPLDWLRYHAGMLSFRAFAEGKATWMLNYSWDGDRVIAPPEPMMTLAMSHVMAGAHFWDAATHVMSGSNDLPTRRRIFEWIAAHEQTLFAPREPIAPTGIYFSPASRNRSPEDFLRSYQGLLILLMRKHLEFQIVTPRTLASFRGPALVLPSVGELDEAERRGLQDQIGRGTRLVVTGADATGLAGSPGVVLFSECPGRAYLDALEKDFDMADASGAEALVKTLPPSEEIDIDASSGLVTQIARVDGRVHVFFANFAGLVAGKNAVQTPQTGVSVRVPEGLARRAVFLPFLGEARPIEGEVRDGARTFELPPIAKGAVLWLEAGS